MKPVELAATSHLTYRRLWNGAAGVPRWWVSFPVSSRFAISQPLPSPRYAVSSNASSSRWRINGETDSVNETELFYYKWIQKRADRDSTIFNFSWIHYCRVVAISFVVNKGYNRKVRLIATGFAVSLMGIVMSNGRWEYAINNMVGVVS